MARRLLLRPGVGEHLLTTKLLILNGTHRPSNSALSMLTGRIAVPSLDVADVQELESDLVSAPIETAVQRSRHFSARTVYLSEHHLRDVDWITDAWQLIDSRRLSRSAVVRRAVEHLRAAVEADPAKSMLENE